MQYDRAVQTDAVAATDPSGQADGEQEAPITSSNILLKLCSKMNSDAPKQDVSVKAVAGVWKSAGKQKARFQDELRAKQLSLEEREKVEQTKEFRDFFDRTTLMIERALGKQTTEDIPDLTGDADLDIDAAAEPLRFIEEYSEVRWASRRTVTDVRFSPHQGDMFLASYGQRANPSLADPEGCLLVWNLAMRNRPELAFTCSSGVLTANFHCNEPALFFGGTYAGGVVLWDARVKSEPVLRSPASGSSHTHPVQALQQVGTRNSSNLITASNDGRLCKWSTAMLGAPQECIDLRYDSKSRRELAVMSLCFPEGELNTLYVGAEDGAFCQVHIHGAKVGITEIFDGHEGPVTGVHMHPSSLPADSQFSSAADTTKDLALSSSFDWSVKLWSVKEHRHPILSLDCFEDYIFDVKWHPCHPAVFATVDCEGHVDLWNLNENIEAPALRTENPNQRRLAVSHCDWSRDGRKLVTGDSEGTLSMFSADRSFSEPRGTEILAFEEKVRQLQPIIPRSASSGGDADRSQRRQERY